MLDIYKKYDEGRTASRGNLYYVRLTTTDGQLYKLGFTTCSSVEERLSYKGSEDYKLIDEVLLFAQLPDAYEKEQILHKEFAATRAYKSKFSLRGKPLYRNGQSELYREDILGLDTCSEPPTKSREEIIKDGKEARLSLSLVFGGLILCLTGIGIVIGIIMLIAGFSGVSDTGKRGMAELPQKKRGVHPMIEKVFAEQECQLRE